MHPAGGGLRPSELRFACTSGTASESRSAPPAPAAAPPWLPGRVCGCATVCQRLCPAVTSSALATSGPTTIGAPVTDSSGVAFSHRDGGTGTRCLCGPDCAPLVCTLVDHVCLAQICACGPRVRLCTLLLPTPRHRHRDVDRPFCPPRRPAPRCSALRRVRTGVSCTTPSKTYITQAPRKVPRTARVPRPHNAPADWQVSPSTNA